MSAVLELIDITKRYLAPDGTTTTVLDTASLTLQAGEELALGGPSGAGKTTLLHIAAGLLLPTSGTARVLGTTTNTLSEAARDQFRAQNIGYVFQRANLLDGFSALENVLLAMGFAGTVPPDQRRARAAELLAGVGLAERLHHRPNQLSSGQQQRVALARAIANAPTLVLADEPTASVDYETGRQIVGLLRRSCAERGAALLLVSHDRALLASFSQVIELRGGQLLTANHDMLDERPTVFFHEAAMAQV